MNDIMNLRINMTQHLGTAQQGHFDWQICQAPDGVRGLLNVQAGAPATDLRKQVAGIVDAVLRVVDLQVDIYGGEVQAADLFIMVGGHFALTNMLVKALADLANTGKVGKVVIAFAESNRVSVDKEVDGKVVKTSRFVHVGFRNAVTGEMLP